MRGRIRVIAGLAAAGLITAGAAAVAVPAFAGGGSSGAGSTATERIDNGPGPGWGPGDGHGMQDRVHMRDRVHMQDQARTQDEARPQDRAQLRDRTEMRDRIQDRARDGSCLMIDGIEQGTLTDEQATTLVAMAEEEKLAGDLYEAFAAGYDLVIFDRIAAAEDQHLTAVRALLERYGLDDPTAGLAAGEFKTAEVQARYDTLLAQGMAGQTAALEVGRQVEEADVTELRAALDGLTAPDVQQVYEHQLTASLRHLDAFISWLDR